MYCYAIKKKDGTSMTIKCEATTFTQDPPWEFRKCPWPGMRKKI